MEQHVKIIVGGVALFILGGLSVYLITTRPDAIIPSSTAQPVQSASAATPAPTSTPNTDAGIADTESFYTAAEARRKQQLEDKAESDRLAKLKIIKERSLECKFWKQQNKTSSAAAKIDEKIDEHCNLPSSSTASASSTNDSSATTSTSPLAP